MNQIENTFFSIIIPTYNRSLFLVDTIESVKLQSFTNWECIVIDDGSTDNTQEIVKQFMSSDDRIKYFYQENSERGAARNNGIERSAGKYICFLDSDDHYLSNHLKVLYDQISLSNFSKSLFFTNAYSKNNNLEISNRHCPDLDANSPLAYILNYTFNPARIAVHNEILRHEKFDPTIPGLEDLDLWLRIALNYPVIQIKERTVVYFLHDNTYTLGESSRFEKELVNFKYIFKKSVFKNRLPLTSKKRLLSMCHYHLAIQHDKNRMKFYYHALHSFFKYPRGYNGKTNKILFVNAIYVLPLIGLPISLLIKRVKNIKL
jgi:glycosyltransferase involved in cell wall biosynthesis